MVDAAIPASRKARPFLKWAGGKGSLLAQYQDFFPSAYRTYFEPFLGGGAVFFHLCPSQAVLTDINPELVNVYTCVRDHVEDLIGRLAEHQARHSREYFYAQRALVPDTPLGRAARLIYLNKTCFNGLYRENSRGGFNVPMGRYRNPTILDGELLRAAAQCLSRSRIEVRSFEGVLADAHSPEDFVYLDPPYHPLSTTSSFTAYSRFRFGEAEQIQLRIVFGTLADRGVRVMLSNSDCDFIRDLYQGYSIQPIQASRAINSRAEKRGKVSEVLVLSDPLLPP